MAALVITAANVDAGDGEIGHGLAGEAITAGQAVYFDRATQTYKLADANTAAAARVAGIAVCNAAAGQIVAFQGGGSYTVGATLVKGTVYFLAPVPGAIGAAAEVLSGDYVTILGVASSTTVMALAIHATGIAI